MPRGRPRGSVGSKIKGAMSPYACFVKTCREEHQKLHPEEDVKFGEFSAQCSQRWKTMTDQEKERFREMALEDKERFEYQMKDFVPMHGPGMGRRRRRRQRREKDPNKPKRALSAFFFFAAEVRPSIREKNPDFTVGECAKELGKRWSEMDALQKSPYEKQAEEDKARYDSAMKNYRGGSIGSSGSRGDSTNGHILGLEAGVIEKPDDSFMDEDEEEDYEGDPTEDQAMHQMSSEQQMHMQSNY